MVGVLLLIEAVFAETTGAVDTTVVAVVDKAPRRDRGRADVARVASGLVFHLLEVEGLVEVALVDLVPGAGVDDDALFSRENEVVELVVVREGEVEGAEEQGLVLVFERPEPGEEEELVQELPGEPRVLVVIGEGIGIRRGGHGVLQSEGNQGRRRVGPVLLKR